MLTGNERLRLLCIANTRGQKYRLFAVHRLPSCAGSNQGCILGVVRASRAKVQNMHQTTQECRLQGTSVHLTRFYSRKRPFVALSQTQCCHVSHTRDPRRASSGSRPSVSRSARELQAGPLRAATLGTAEAAFDSIEATNVTPEALSQAAQRQRFDWHNQWYAIGYERWASQELNTNCVVMECQQHDMSLTL